MSKSACNGPFQPQPLVFELAGEVRIAGDGFGDPDAPPVVFLHGGGQTRHAWANTARTVAAGGYYAIAVDHRGHGDSSWAPDRNYQFDAFMYDLLGVLAEIDKMPILVGASLGGIAAMLAEGQSTSSICTGLVLVDITPRLQIDGVRRVLNFMSANPAGFASLEDAAAAIAQYLPHRSRPTDLRGLKKNLRRRDNGRYYWHWDPALLHGFDVQAGDAAGKERVEAFQRRLMDAARSLTVPTLLVRGQQSDVVSEDTAREFLDAVPHAQYIDVQAAGHMVAGDRNDAFTAAVLDFLAAHS